MTSQTQQRPAWAKNEVVNLSRDMVAMLTEMVKQNSENPPGDTEAIVEFVAGALEARGHAVERHPVPGPFARRHGRSDVTNLIVRHQFARGGPTVALHAPLDTLPAGGGWNRDPFGGEMRSGRLYGRGTRDSKGDAVAYIFALEALAVRADRLAGQVELHLTADEESGGALGPAFLLSHGLTTPNVAIGPGTAYQVVTGQQGLLQLEVLIRGRQAHASRPDAGVDAIGAALPILSALYEAVEASPHPLTVSTIRAGRGVNLLADEARFTIDRRLAVDETADTAEAALTALITGSHTVTNAKLEVRRLTATDPVEPSLASNALAATISAHATTVMERTVPVVSAPVVSGARHYAQAGIATALFGPGAATVAEGVPANEDEFVEIADLERAAETVALTLSTLLARG